LDSKRFSFTATCVVCQASTVIAVLSDMLMTAESTVRPSILVIDLWPVTSASVIH